MNNIMLFDVIVLLKNKYPQINSKTKVQITNDNNYLICEELLPRTNCMPKNACYSRGRFHDALACLMGKTIVRPESASTHKRRIDLEKMVVGDFITKESRILRAAYDPLQDLLLINPGYFKKEDIQDGLSRWA